DRSARLLAAGPESRRRSGRRWLGAKQPAPEAARILEPDTAIRQIAIGLRKIFLVRRVVEENVEIIREGEFQIPHAVVVLGLLPDADLGLPAGNRFPIDLIARQDGGARHPNG